jgi:hypothetical protein
MEKIIRGSMGLADERYLNSWMAALDEMRRPDWREVHDETTKAIAQDRGEDLDVIVKVLGFDGSSRRTRSKPTRRPVRPRRRSTR